MTTVLAGRSKTGTKYWKLAVGSKNQLETWDRMEVLLSVYSVIAWNVLELRKLARGGLPTLDVWVGAVWS